MGADYTDSMTTISNVILIGPLLLGQVFSEGSLKDVALTKDENQDYIFVKENKTSVGIEQYLKQFSPRPTILTHNLVSPTKPPKTAPTKPPKAAPTNPPKAESLIENLVQGNAKAPELGKDDKSGDITNSLSSIDVTAENENASNQETERSVEES